MSIHIVLSKVLVTVHVPVSQKFDLFHILKSLEHVPFRHATTALFQNETCLALKNNPVNPPVLSALPRFAGTSAILIQILWGCTIYLIIMVKNSSCLSITDYFTDTLHQESPPTLSLEYFGDNYKVGFWTTQGEWQPLPCVGFRCVSQRKVDRSSAETCAGERHCHTFPTSHCPSPPLLLSQNTSWDFPEVANLEQDKEILNEA